MTTPSTSSDLFPEALNLEDAFYAEGHALGVSDGQRAGLIEGRVFGFEKGYEKFIAMGRLRGRGEVWSARMKGNSNSQKEDEQEDGVAKKSRARERLERNLYRLMSVTDLETLDTRNTEQAVDEFDERMREAGAKAVVVARGLGESCEEEAGAGKGKAPVRGAGLRIKEVGGRVSGAGEMEDFAGLPGAKR